MTYTEEQINILKTKIISIGTCCRYNLYKKQLFLDIYLSNNPYNKSKIREIDTGITHFFDWLLCCYPNNIRILEIDSAANIFNSENWKINKRRKSATLQYNIDFDHGYLIKSLHDLTENMNLQEDVVNKYIRRHARLIDTIKTTLDLVFIYDTYLSDDHVDNINNSIKKLTSHNFIIIIFDSIENDYETHFIKNNNIYRINFNVLYKNELMDYKYKIHPTNINITLLFSIILKEIIHI